jgi:hypothetical protein
VPFFGFRFLGKQEMEQMLTIEVFIIMGLCPEPQLLFFVRKKSNQKNSSLENPLTVRSVAHLGFSKGVMKK